MGGKRNDLSVIARALGRIVDAGLALSAIAVLAMMLLITVEVLGRNLLRVSTLVADEMSGYLLVIVTFLGLAYTLRTGGFIRVDTYRARLRGRARRALDLVIYALAAGYVAVLDWYFWGFTIASYRFGSTSIYFTQTPLWIPHACMALGGTLLLVEILAGLALVAQGCGPGDGHAPSNL